MPIPESQKSHNDIIDMIIEGCQTVEDVPQPDGSVQKQLVLDPEIPWWKTQLVNSETFGRYAFEFKEFERLSVSCYDNMSSERAHSLAQQILGVCNSFKRSIDAKSSESKRDKNNTQTTLVDKIIKNKQERVYQMKGEMKKSLMDGIMGREAAREDNDG